MNLDPTQMADWQIAEAAVPNMRSTAELAEAAGLTSDELIPMGRHLAKLDYARILERIGDRSSGKLINVTAITPTPLGEGKTTTTMGLVQGLGRLGKRVVGAIRQPSGGPTFNIKGSAGGGGLAQCIPLTELSFGLTGDIDAINNAHNLSMVALNARMQHERNYDDARLARSNLKRLDIDPERVEMQWVIDFCAQGLRNITIGQGGKMDGFEMPSGFQITVSSELMAILAVSRDLADLRRRMGRIVMAYDRRGNEVTTADLEVDGAMTAWMLKAIDPTLMQTLEGQPILVHAGPFANIAIGQSSVIADRLGTAMADYTVTESGFGADIGFEKFWNLKCRMSGIKPAAVVLVATIRALKMHGGGPTVKPGLKLDPVYTKENLELLENGCSNLIAHIEIVRLSGIQPVVCINHFHTDSEAEIALVRRIAEAQGAQVAVSKHWRSGGAGAEELANAVIEACEKPNEFDFLYSLETPLRDRIDLIARDVYGADGVSYSDSALATAEALEADPENRGMSACMVKTHLSLSHDPELKGRPRGFTLPIRDFLVFKGAGFIAPVAGDIKLLPGTASNPAYRNIDVDVDSGQVRGLF
ncbi:MAG: formate--tetrahydrofolate ligase [Lentisphaeria bacterium]|jgi:formate--tetrahydrofolate ligase|nr:formate--tetrahydrofolate ligase [Lentisphaeria bacterium]